VTRISAITDHSSRSTNHSSDMLYRLMKFAAVGAAGVAVQALMLALLLRVAGPAPIALGACAPAVQPD